MSDSMTPFEFHTGMHFASFKATDGKDQWRGTCPFCRKIDHFFFGGPPTFGWSCKSCQLEGNLYTFLKHIYSDTCDTSLIDVLAIQRGITYETLMRNGIRRNINNGCFVIPTFTEKGTINNLYKVTQLPSGKLIVMTTPGIEPTLISWPQIIHKTVWVTEGPWDKMAAEDIVGPREITVVGVPGSVFKQYWCNIFANTDLVLLSDNDSAGQKIRERIIHRITNSPAKPTIIRHLAWPSGTKSKYDINDLLRDKNSSAYHFIVQHLVDNDVADAVAPSTDIIADTTCTSFEDLESACRETYHFTNDMRLLLQFLLACLYSLKIEGEQLWVRVIGPPGSSKTTLAKIAGASEQSIMRSTFTGLLSGWKDDDPKDASLIPMIAGKFLIVKDGDALLQLPNIQKILSELRDFYDKFISATYLNRVSYEYNNIRSGFCFCGTHALRNMDNSALGERFLDFELKVTLADRAAITARAMKTAIDEALTGKSPEPAIAAKAKNFIDNILLNQEGVATLRPEHLHMIDICGDVISYLRAKVERNKAGEIAYTPLPEVPSRITKQMVKLYQCVPLVLGKSEPDDITYELGRKITLDIIDTTSNRFKICNYLCGCPQQTMLQVVEATQIQPKIVERELENMRALDMLRISRIATGLQTSVPAASLREDIRTKLQELMNP